MNINCSNCDFALVQLDCDAASQVVNFATNLEFFYQEFFLQNDISYEYSVRELVQK